MSMNNSGYRPDRGLDERVGVADNCGANTGGRAM